MEHPTRYTLGEAMSALGIANRRTLDKWLKRFQITPQRHEHDWRFLLITEEEVERIRVARASMPQSAPQRIPRHHASAISPAVVESAPSPRIPIASAATLRRAAPITRVLGRGDAPAGWEPVPRYVRDLHGVPLITLQKAIGKGRHAGLAVTHERHKWQRTYVTNWLTPEQQAVFHRAFRGRLGEPCAKCGWSEFAPKTPALVAGDSTARDA